MIWGISIVPKPEFHLASVSVPLSRIAGVANMRMRFGQRERWSTRAWSEIHDEDPLAGIANLFDVSVAFIVALLIALFALFSAGSMLDPNSNVTLVKQTEAGTMEIIIKEGAKITVHEVSDDRLTGRGTRLGTAYRLANGQVVYVPDGGADD